MLENHEHIANLIYRFNSGTITESERVELDQWIRVDAPHRLIFEKLVDPEYLKEQFIQVEIFNEEKNWEKLKQRHRIDVIPVRKIFHWKRNLSARWRIAIAASLILMVGAGTYYAFFNNSSKKAHVAKHEHINTDVEAPKGTKATITLTDGSVVSIDSLSVISQTGVRLTKTTDGKLVYAGHTTEIAYNTLSNPKGSKVIDMTLSDGSHVWLNAGSSITYPISFAGNERKVEMTGEGYFEITSSPNPSTGGVKRPFIVSKGDMDVTVLGTHFNVNAYDDESEIKVTLFEGSVKVSLAIGHRSSVIAPGQQAVLTANGQLSTLNNVDLDAVIAWKNGRFLFTDTELKTIMRQVMRWYDVDVVYAENIPVRYFTADISRNTNLSQLLKVLEMSNVHFKIEGKTLTVIQ